MGYEEKAEELGVAIIDGYPPNGWWACYDPDTHTILRHVNLGALQRHSSTWHELGHAHFRHIGCNPKQEAQASMWASRHLISVDAFVAAAQIDDDLIGIAHRLFVLPRDVKYFVKSLSFEEMLELRKRIGWGTP
ncbi:ImmA/IrrE family metallo-endopeptidase [Paenarthrobacter sp. Y-19]|uniref:ImmA/IrrE family metallo-endopeptidase n=1 Tax=Paenarthrobacter sp. Y-19 TaxID=3031125 RepID=UPI0023DB7320|nr:ImmA/IrrE family metallo-endopeptidase [Paenarthrobacter sp. Y-19]